ncbi:MULTISPECIES: lysylphosphatidylglycerol synthase domain-containing protein [unclassified Sphingobacterium]|uniref:lysylphosphatidylglycerol synthase domain-containing protein n=1 Tax=unclassified Sphingobacterium TaxID=2609468 RepID=UPI0025FDDA85|nr:MULTISPECIES: lysylphosphatidylglycerol synthase domain-containing protein [unclassified Sphingobacterium]
MGKLTQLSKLIKGIFLFLVLTSIAIFLAQSNLTAIKKELSSVGYHFIVILFTTFAAYSFGTLAWWICLGAAKKKVNLIELFAIRQIGETVGLFNPTSIIGGDLLKADLTTRYNIPLKEGLNSVAISRITAVLSQLTLFLIAICWLILSPLKNDVISYAGPLVYIICILLLLVMILIFYWLIVTKNPSENKASTATVLGKAKAQVLSLLLTVKDFYRNQNKTFWYSYLLFVLHWTVGSLEFYYILKFLGTNVQPIHGLILDMSVIVLKSIGAFIPGQLGIEEIANKLLLSMVGITGTSIWLSVSLLRRSRQLIWVAIGFIFYLFIKKKPAHVFI